ncbi:MAG: tetratricopeptide repeat protein [Bacteroidaceae bacterium]|nr:tetratricopeptide repeat protein [Bacteroidaceae bacterium]
MRKTIAACVVATLFTTAVMAQSAPKWASKVSKGIVSVMTYDKNDNLLHSGTGFFINTRGEAVADYAVFEGASKAVVLDATGKKYDVDYILGADETYGLVKFSAKIGKNDAIQPVVSVQNIGATVYALAYSPKDPSFQAATISEVSAINDSVKYYATSKAIDGKFNSCPAFTQDGQLFGMVQPSMGGKGYILDVNHLRTLVISAIPSKKEALALDKININKGLPPSVGESLVYLFFKSRTASNEDYLSMLNLFIKTYPDNPEGYLRRATPLTDLLRFDEAENDLQTYLKLAPERDQALYNVCQLIHNKLIYQPEHKYEKWTFERAMGLIDEALTINPKLDYKLEKAQLHVAMQEYDKAYAIYDELNHGSDRSPATLYAASLAAEARGDSLNEVIELMDSALAMFPTPRPAEAADFVLRRGRLFNAAGKYRDAVKDYNEFCFLSNNKVNSTFYYDKAQLETKARMYQQAIQDIESAISAEPREPLYYLEKCGIMLRVNQLDEAVKAAQQTLQLDSQNSDAYRMLGYALLQKGDKTGALQNLNRAKELGDEAAQEIINTYLK